MRLPFFLGALCGAVLLLVTGCPVPAPTPGFDTRPDGFGNLSDKATDWASRASAGTAVTGERLAAGDLPGAKKANDLTGALFDAPRDADLEWFRKLLAPDTTLAELAKSKTENATLLSTVKTLQAKVANGISPEEAARRTQDALDAQAARDSKKWRNRILYGVCGLTAAASIGFIGAGVYFGIRRVILVGGVLIPCSAFIGKIPDFLDSAAFQKVQTAVTYALGVAILGLLAFGVYEVVKWLRSAKALTVAEAAGTLIKAAT